MIHPSPQAEDTANRVAGVPFGIAAGDRIGGPIRMTLECAESLADQGAFDSVDIGARYLRWWEAEGFDTGPTAERVFGGAVATPGTPLRELARQVDHELGGMTAGCNPAHRAAPLAMLATLPDPRLGAAARAEAALTHAHPLAGDVSAAVVVLARALIRGTDWRTAVARAAADRLPESQGAMVLPGAHPPSRGGFAPEVLHAALVTLDASPDFGTAMERALALAGPANYAPVLVGILGGARWGRRAIPEELIRMHAGLGGRIEAVCRQLVGGWPSPSGQLARNHPVGS